MNVSTVPDASRAKSSNFSVGFGPPILTSRNTNRSTSSLTIPRASFVITNVCSVKSQVSITLFNETVFPTITPSFSNETKMSLTESS